MTGAADLIMGRAIPATSSPVCSLPLIEAGTLHEVPQHSTECLYQYALARLNLADTQELRTLFWDAQGALAWDDESDAYVPPQLGEDVCPACVESGGR